MKQPLKCLIQIILCSIMLFTLVSCGESSSSSEESWMSDLKEKVKYQVEAYCYLNYSAGIQSITYNIRSVDDDTYYVSGKVTIWANGSTASGTYEIRAEYDESDEDNYDFYNLKVSKFRIN